MKKQRTFDEAEWKARIKARDSAPKGSRNKKAFELTNFVHDLMRRDTASQDKRAAA